MKLFESVYGTMIRFSFSILNPFKKAVLNTQCKVHKFINVQGLKILKNEEYCLQYDFFMDNIVPLNDGAVWADQDFKSSSHFYNPHSFKGLYGQKNALDLTKEYYSKAVELWYIGEKDKSLFYFGAVLHIIQDMTIPQHANVRLLDNHRQYENFVKKTYQYIDDFIADKGPYLLNSIDEYVRFNARTAIKIYHKFKIIEDDNQRFYRITHCSLPLAQRTTAGCMLLFYNTIFNPKILIRRNHIYQRESVNKS